VGDKSSIEWTDATWTPIRARVKADAAAIAEQKQWTSLLPIVQQMAGHVGPHCERVSPGCERCYSETNNGRCLPNNGTGLPFDRRARELVDIFVDENILAQPLHWRSPKKVFVCSQTDLFGEWVLDGFIMRCLDVMARTPQNTYQILTKRPERMLDFFKRWADLSGETFIPKLARGPEATRKAHPSGRGQLFASMLESMGTPPEGCAYPTFDWIEGMIRWPKTFRNIWLGVSVEDQKRADERIPLLLQTPAAVRWISAEPLLDLVDLDRWVNIRWQCSGCHEYFSDSLPLDKKCPTCGRVGYWSGSHIFNGNPGRKFRQRGSGLDWVVVGGESGSGARPMHPDWVRSLRDQCQAAGVPFLFKQWGEYIPVDSKTVNRGSIVVENEQHFERVGKKAAGRMLDGREWNEYPEAENVTR
jgi:protein gp37